MSEPITTMSLARPGATKSSRQWKNIKRHKSVYLLASISLGYFVIFKYVPIWNAQIAFKDFMALDGVLGSPWVGLQNFKDFVNSYYFWELIRNTVMYSIGKMIFSIPAAIFLSVTLYECRIFFLRKTVQTLAYLPHFLSWVIMYAILLAILSPSNGIVNDVIKLFGGEPISFLTDAKAFPWIVILSDMWKEMGWSAIIFLAALMGIDPSLFEAATVEGANAWQRVRYITLPSIRPVIVMVFLLRLGTILDAGFNQIFMLYSLPVYSVADIIDTWIYRQGLLEFRFGLATAVGLFKGVFGLILIVVSNKLIRKHTDSGLY
ncbi:MAG: ABC transporter permease subunit [Rectinemataceae bacterium]|nr:ABC transporter permease subunit [Rectinemataceae bacterium]